MAHAHKSNGSNGSLVTQTLDLVREYRGPNDAVVLINCLLGLLMTADETAFERIPSESLKSLRAWGVTSQSIRQVGTCECGNGHPQTLRQLVAKLRSAAARFDAKPLHHNGRCTGLEFHDASGFHAILKTAQMRRFVQKLAEHLAANGEDNGTKPSKAKYVASWQQEPFHRPACKWAHRIQRENVQRVLSRKDALEAGHRPCKVCKP